MDQDQGKALAMVRHLDMDKALVMDRGQDKDKDMDQDKDKDLLGQDMVMAHQDKGGRHSKIRIALHSDMARPISSHIPSNRTSVAHHRLSNCQSDLPHLVCVLPRVPRVRCRSSWPVVSHRLDRASTDSPHPSTLAGAGTAEEAVAPSVGGAAATACQTADPSVEAMSCGMRRNGFGETANT